MSTIGVPAGTPVSDAAVADYTDFSMVGIAG